MDISIFLKIIQPERRDRNLKISFSLLHKLSQDELLSLPLFV